MDRGRVEDERGSKEMDGCPLTDPVNLLLKFVLSSVPPEWFEILSTFLPCMPTLSSN
jgi:hypothetical protein